MDLRIVLVGHLLKAKKQYKILKKLGIQNELDEACFQHEMAYGDFKDLPRKTASDKMFCDKALNIAKYKNMMDIKEVLFQWFVRFLIRSPQVVVLKIKICQTRN